MLVSLISKKMQSVEFNHLLSTNIQLNADKSMVNSTYTSRNMHILKNFVSVDQCTFIKCSYPKEKGGGLFIFGGNVSISNSIFNSCTARSSGAIDITDSNSIDFTSNSVYSCKAQRVAACFFDGHSMSSVINLEDSNFTNNEAEIWTGCFRLQHNSGKISNCNFNQNSAAKYGTIFEFSSHPGYKSFFECKLINNTASENSAGLTLFLMKFHGDIDECIFQNNNNCSIIVASDSCSVEVNNCVFSKSKSEELIKLYKTCEVYLSHCKFDVNGTQDTAK